MDARMMRLVFLTSAVVLSLVPPRAVAQQPSAPGAAALTQDSAPRRRPRPPVVRGRNSGDSSAIASLDRDSIGDTRWPVRGLPTPGAGAIVPARRIVAFYGNPLSTRMGILGELPPDQMLARLDREVAAWRAADPNTPVVPALHLIVTVAQGSAGPDGRWRARMNDSLIARVARWAESREALLFLDIQVGKSTIEQELPVIMKWLERPNVHLGIDPEFSMKTGANPGSRVGTYDARDINWVIGQLSQLVRARNLPPKVLIVHRYTRPMVTNAAQIRPDSNVQVVMHMDGWGPPAVKISSYRSYVRDEPVQYTGFKLFYKNDVKSGARMMHPSEVLRLWPRPMYIQYQ
jgi:hypothetical protein